MYAAAARVSIQRAGVRGTCLCGVLAVLTAATWARSDDLPRYRLAEGDELRFERLALAAAAGTGAVESRISEKVDIACIEDRDGRWLMLVIAVRITDGRVEPVRAGVFEMDRRGARSVSPALARDLIELEPALDALPVLQSSLDPGPEWETPPDAWGRLWKCRTGDADPEHEGAVRIAFRRTDPTGVSDILGEERFGRFWYDPRAGVVTRAEAEERGPAARPTVQSKIKLRQRVNRGAEWARARAQEARAFVRAAEHAARIESELFTDGEPVELVLSRIERIWSGLEAEIRVHPDSPLRGVASAARQRAADAAPGLRSDARTARGWLGQAADDWSLADAGGAGVRAADLRPRVELTWSSATADGLRVLASARRLQERLEERGVPLICLNTDPNPESARRAAELCGRGLRIVAASSRAGEAGEDGRPAVRWVDERGLVRRALVGWRADLEAVMP